MANLVKTVLTFDDGSTQEFAAAPAVAPAVVEAQVQADVDATLQKDIPATPAA